MPQNTKFDGGLFSDENQKKTKLQNSTKISIFDANFNWAAWNISLIKDSINKKIGNWKTKSTILYHL